MILGCRGADYWSVESGGRWEYLNNLLPANTLFYLASIFITKFDTNLNVLALIGTLNMSFLVRSASTICVGH